MGCPEVVGRRVVDPLLHALMPFDPFQRPSTVVESLESQNYADILARSQASWDEGSLVSSLSLLLPPVSPGGATPTLPTLLSTSATELSRTTQRQLAALVKSRTESLRVALEGALGVSQPPWAMQGSKQVHHLTLSSRVTLAPPSTPTSTPVPLHAVLEAYQLVCPGVGQGVILATLLPTFREWLWRVAQGGGGGVGTVAKPTSVVLELYCNPPPSSPQGSSSSSSSLDVAAVFNCVVQLCSTLPAFFAASPTLTPSLTTLLLLGGSSGSGSKQQLLPFPRLLDALADTLPPTFPPSSQSPPHQEALGTSLGAALHIYDRAVWDASAQLLHLFLPREATASPSLFEGAALRWWGTVSGLTEALCKGFKDVAAAAAAAAPSPGATAAAAAAVVGAVHSFTPSSLLPRVGMILRNAALLEGKACMDAHNSTTLPIGDAIWRVLCTRGGGSTSGKQEEEDVFGEEDSILSLLPKDFPHIHTSINPTSPWLIELLRVVLPSAVGVSVSPPTDFLSWALTSFPPSSPFTSSSSSTTTTTTTSLSPSASSSPPTTTPCAQQLVGVIQCLQAVAATLPPVLSGSSGGTPAAPPAHFSATQAILATTTSDVARLYVAVEGGAFPLHHRPTFGGGKNPTTTTLSKGLKEWARVSSRLLASHNDAAYLAHALSRSADATASGSGSADTGRAMELLRMFAQKALVVVLSQQRERVHAIFNGCAFPSSSSAAAAAGGGGGGGGAEKPPPTEAFLLTTAKAVGEVIFTTATVCQPLLPPSLLHPFLINLCDVSLERVIRTILTAVEDGEGGGGGAGGGDEDEDEEDEEGGGLHTPRHRHGSSSNRLTPPKPPPFASALAHIMAVTQWAFKHGRSSSSSSPWVGIRSWERARAMLYVLTVGGVGGISKDGGGLQELIDLGGLSAEEIKGVSELRSS